MAFALSATAGSTTISLSDGNPFSLLGATGLGGAPVRRVTRRGPAQHGDTDLGYRLQPRQVELQIGFRATTDAILDGYRDQLMSVFKPLSSTVVNLKVTRDDGEIRQLDCYTVGSIDIRLDPAHRPGHYHVATVRVYAPEVAYYDPVPGTVLVGTANVQDEWWLAGGAIGSAQVLDHGESPAHGEAWAYQGSLSHTDTLTIAIRTEKQGTVSGSRYPYYLTSNVINGTAFHVTYWRRHDTTFEVPTSAAGEVTIGDNYMNEGIANYFHSIEVLPYFSGLREYARFTLPWAMPNAVARDRNWVNPDNPGTAGPGTAEQLLGTARVWRSDAAGAGQWEPEIPLYAVYSPKLTDTQILALNTYMGGTQGVNFSLALPIAYEGDLREYPVISITGPITAPSVTNAATGDTLDFGAITIGAGTTYVIDTRYGVKTVLAGTVNKRFELSDDSDLAAWSLVPAPIATGGTNVITVAGSATSAATEVQIVYYNRYSSF